MDSVKEAGSAATTFQLEYDEEVAFTAKRRIFDYAKYRDLPFAMTVSFIHPHDPYVARPEFWDRYEGVEIDLPTSPLAEDPHSLRLRSAIEATDVSVTDEQIANARRAYYANTTYVDSKIGEIVRTLEEAELLDDTIVVFTGDHGDMLGERGLWYKMSTLDHSMRVPLVMAGPGIVHGVSPEPCSLVDMLPTMLDWAAPGAGRRWAWTSTAARCRCSSRCGDRPGATALGEYCAEGSAHPIFMIRRGRWKYVQSTLTLRCCSTWTPTPTSCRICRRSVLRRARSCLRLRGPRALGQCPDSCGRPRFPADAPRRARRNVGRPSGRLGLSAERDASEEYVRNHMDWTVAAATTRSRRSPAQLAGADAASERGV